MVLQKAHDCIANQHLKSVELGTAVVALLLVKDLSVAKNKEITCISKNVEVNKTYSLKYQNRSVHLESL